MTLGVSFSKFLLFFFFKRLKCNITKRRKRLYVAHWVKIGKWAHPWFFLRTWSFLKENRMFKVFLLLYLEHQTWSYFICEKIRSGANVLDKSHMLLYYENPRKFHIWKSITHDNHQSKPTRETQSYPPILLVYRQNSNFPFSTQNSILHFSIVNLTYISIVVHFLFHSRLVKNTHKKCVTRNSQSIFI